MALPLHQEERLVSPEEVARLRALAPVSRPAPVEALPVVGPTASTSAPAPDTAVEAPPASTDEPPATQPLPLRASSAAVGAEPPRRSGLATAPQPLSPIALPLGRGEGQAAPASRPPVPGAITPARLPSVSVEEDEADDSHAWMPFSHSRTGVDFLLSGIGGMQPEDELEPPPPPPPSKRRSRSRSRATPAAAPGRASSGKKSKSSHKGRDKSRSAASAPAEPSFVRQARRRAFWRSRPVRAALWTGLGVLALGLTAQLALSQRAWLAARYPALHPALTALCQPLGCTVGPYRWLDAVVIDSSSFTRTGPNTFSLSFGLRNKARLPVATPALELTLTDSGGQTLVRRVLGRAELGTPERLAPGAEFTGSSALTVDAASHPADIVGYRLLAFYP